MKPRLDLIGLVVEDMGRSLAFYRELGIDLPEDGDRQPHVETTLPGGLRWPGTRRRQSGRSIRLEPASGGQQTGLAFRLDTLADVDAAYERLVSLGYDCHKAPWNAPWGQRYALVRDRTAMPPTCSPRCKARTALPLKQPTLGTTAIRVRAGPVRGSRRSEVAQTRPLVGRSVAT